MAIMTANGTSARGQSGPSVDNDIWPRTTKLRVIIFNRSN